MWPYTSQLCCMPDRTVAIRAFTWLRPLCASWWSKRFDSQVDPVELKEEGNAHTICFCWHCTSQHFLIIVPRNYAKYLRKHSFTQIRHSCLSYFLDFSKSSVIRRADRHRFIYYVAPPCSRMSKALRLSASPLDHIIYQRCFKGPVSRALLA